MFPIFSATEDQARAGGQHVFEGWEYYCTSRAQHPRSAKFFTWNGVDRIASFDAFRFIAMISPRPLFMIVGTDAVTAWMTRDAFANAQEPKELCWIKGATHVALCGGTNGGPVEADIREAFSQRSILSPQRVPDTRAAAT